MAVKNLRWQCPLLIQYANTINRIQSNTTIDGDPQSLLSAMDLRNVNSALGTNGFMRWLGWKFIVTQTFGAKIRTQVFCACEKCTGFFFLLYGTIEQRTVRDVVEKIAHCDVCFFFSFLRCCTELNAFCLIWKTHARNFEERIWACVSSMLW